ncbi:hypothetical protein QBC32DRAFT_312663 [Pseudoneurospora amorphoporcata]|uniref:Uncharacterized protein n=1 Tax=Pseudoneurospora amorphoporcata TaxID=241081 RepID=A0AAN6NX70_9PEZI|nr:hypothetical protein QBC32DRAFT_312663 [Pseudoneurospora amorphoporcata]
MSESANPPPLARLASPATSVPGQTQPFTEFLPELKYLCGLFHVDQWKYDMRLYLNHHGLLEFIDGTHENGQANVDVETPASWRRRRAHAYTILRSKLNNMVFPMLLTAGLRAFEDDYDFDPQELWNYIVRYVRLPKRDDSLKDRMLLFLFHVNADYDYEDYDAADYLYLRRKLRDQYGIHVHPKVMNALSVKDEEIFEDDMARGYDWRSDESKAAKFMTEGHRNLSLRGFTNHEEFMVDPEDPKSRMSSESPPIIRLIRARNFF